MKHWCGHCRGHFSEDHFQRIAPEKVVDDHGRQVVYLKHTKCGYKTSKGGQLVARGRTMAGTKSTAA